MSELVGKCFVATDEAGKACYLVVREQGQEAVALGAVFYHDGDVALTRMGASPGYFDECATNLITRAEFDKAYNEAKARIEELLK